jgi:hypothetical protein
VLGNGGTYQITSGRFAATRCDISGSSAARALDVGATASASFADSTLVATGADTINVASGGAFDLTRCRVNQLQAGGSAIVQAGVPPFFTGSALFCVFNIAGAGGYVAKGTGVFVNGNNLFPNNANVQSSLTLFAVPGAPVVVP